MLDPGKLSALRKRIASLDEAKRLLLRKQLESQGIEWHLVDPDAAESSDTHASAPGATLQPLARPARVPLSASQAHVWVLHQLYPDLCAYHIAYAWSMRGDYQESAMRSAFERMANRHEALRTSFPLDEDGQPYQHIQDTVQLVFDSESIDIDNKQADNNADQNTTQDKQDPLQSLPATLQKRATDFARHGFDLQNGPLYRVLSIKVANNHHVMVLVLHHMIADGWSRGVLMRELATHYNAACNDTASALPELPIQFADHVLHQQRWRESSAYQQQLDYWRQQLQDMTELELSTDRPRPAGATFACSVCSQLLPPQLSAQLKQLARNNGVTYFMLLLAAFKLFMSRYSGQNDIAVGVPVSGRLHQELITSIGFFVNTLVMRTQFDAHANSSFIDWLLQVKATVAGGLENQAVPFSDVVEACAPERSTSHNPLFEIMFQAQTDGYQTQNAAIPDVDFNDLSIEQHIVMLPQTKFDMSWHMMEREDGLMLAVEFRNALYEKASIQRMMQHLHGLLKTVVQTPDAALSTINLLDDTELKTLSHWERGATRTADPRTAPLRFLEAATEHATRTALIAQHRSNSKAESNNNTDLGYTGMDYIGMDYVGMQQQVYSLAQLLQHHNIKHGMRVGVLLPRTHQLPASMLAIMMNAAVYVPLDRKMPVERLRYIADDAGVELILHDNDANFIKTCFANNITAVDVSDNTITNNDINLPAINAEDTAYIIYTSGSTGKPKGVAISHAALGNFLDAMSTAPGIDHTDRLLAVTTIAFDISILELLLPLCRGACVVLATSEHTRDADQLAYMLDKYDVSIMQASPASWRLLLANAWQGKTTLRMLCGGEALDSALAKQLLSKGTELWNMYGPTETTIWSGALRVTEKLLDGIHVPVGAPVLNTQLRVLNSDMQTCPLGVIGELHIGGAGLAQAYWQRPALTAERFITDQRSGEQLYRSGDLVRRRTDGLLDYIGRTDYQVKLRGHRIELGEIEAALTNCNNVEQAIVLVMNDAQQEPQLVAFITLTDSQIELDTSATRDKLSQSLPVYMLPNRYQVIEKLPLTLSGKIDRKALPALLQQSNNDSAADIVLDSPLQQRIARAWMELLGVETIKPNDNFFELGGHSLAATRLITRLRTLTGADLPLAMLFDNPRFIDFVTALQEVSDSDGIPIINIETISRDTSSLPVSPAQRRQWLMAELTPDNPMYGIPTAVKLKGALNLAALEWSLSQLAARHENLRVRFIEQDGELVAIDSHNIDIVLEHKKLPENETTDTTIGTTTDASTQVTALLQQHANASFQLDSAPLWRALLIEQGNDEYVFALTLHHILADGWSMDILVREIASLYRSFDVSITKQAHNQNNNQTNKQKPVLPALAIQYADYAAWVTTLDHSKELDYWQQQLSGLPTRLELPVDFPYPAEQSYAGATHRFTISAETRDALQTLGQGEGNTLFMTLMSAFAVLLKRLSGFDDIAIGTPIANRGHADTEALIGLFVNTLVMRIDVADDPTFNDLLTRTRDTALAAWQHQQAPFEAVLERLNVERSRSHAPLFQVMFSLQNAPFNTVEVDGIAWSPLAIDNGTAKFDLMLTLHETGNGIDAAFEYRTDLFKETRIQGFASMYCTLLQHLARHTDEHISRLPIIDQATQQQLLAWSHGNADAPLPEHTIHSLFTTQAKQNPDATALIQGDAQIRYGELEQRSNQLAQLLRGHGVEHETAVMILAERTTDTVIAILAVLKAGGVYVPLDSSLPASRQQMLIDDANASLLLHSRSETTGLSELNIKTLCIDAVQNDIASQPGHVPNAMVHRDQLAYIMYTSGSTGTPKGVCTPHRGVTRLVKQSAYASFSADDVFLQSAPLGFDAATLELWGPLLNGGCLVLPPVDVDGPLALDTLAELVATHRVTTLWLTAGLFNLMIDAEPQRLQTVKQLLAGGDVLSVEHLRKAHATLPDTQLINGYGPTENTTFTCCHAFTDNELADNSDMIAVPIGQAIGYTNVYILDEHMQPVPPGVTGELYIGGEGLARGYLGQPALTAERFVPNPFFRDTFFSDVATTLYRSGDRVRWNDNGHIEFMGRVDTQVKIRGFRIEPGEIEQALLSHQAVADAVVVATGEHADSKRLAAYLVAVTDVDAAQQNALHAAHWRQYLLQRLPVQFVPSAFIWLEQLPLNRNGKVDTSALPQPDWSQQSQPAETSDDETENSLLEIWQGLLPATDIHRHTNFFDAGGDSIIALQIVSQAGRIGLKLSPMQLFQYQTVAELACVVEYDANNTGAMQIAEGEVGLLPVQQWFLHKQSPQPAHFNQAVAVRLPSELEQQRFEQALHNVVAVHDAFRLRFEQNDNGNWQQAYQAGDANIAFSWYGSADSGSDSNGGADNHHQFVETTVATLHSNMHLTNGPLLQAAVFDQGNKGHLLVLIAHHLVVDAVSWRIVFDDLARAYMQPQSPLLPEAVSYQSWASALHDVCDTLEPELSYWQQVVDTAVTAIPYDCEADIAVSCYGNVDKHLAMLDQTATEQLVQQVARHSGHDARSVILTALVQTLANWCDASVPAIAMEFHGRDADALGLALDVSRTVGWFTAIYPFTPQIDPNAELLQQLESVSNSLDAVPGKGMGYGLLRYTAGHTALALDPAIAFNYLGQLDTNNGFDNTAQREQVPGPLHADDNPRAHLIELNAWIDNNGLSVEWSYDKHLHQHQTIVTLADRMIATLQQLITSCCALDTKQPPADTFELAGLDDDGLSAVLSQIQFGADD